MNTITNLISTANLFLLSMGIICLLIKIALYYKVEKQWDPIRFLHFSKIDLKMTVSRDLRNWRKRQNVLTVVFLTFAVLYALVSFFHMLVSSS